MAAVAETAWVTMLTSDAFLIAAEVLIKSLRKHSVGERPVVALVTANVGTHARKSLAKFGASIRDVEAIPTPAEAASVAGSSISHEPGWVGTGYTKLHLWKLTEFHKVVYIDCDCLVTENIDELFLRPGKPCPAAAPDVFPPDRFNAGVLVVEPSSAVFADMMSRVASTPTCACSLFRTLSPPWREFVCINR